MSTFWRDAVREVEEFKESAGESGRGCLDLVINYQSRENFVILRNWGACVDTVFVDTYLWARVWS